MIGEHILIPTNEYQTPITEELLGSYPTEVKDQFLEVIAAVPFIQNLISPSRPKIEDLPRDAKGRAIIDITNPPLYKDADYFRKTILYFQEEGCYTKLKPNSNPNSEYRRFWAREISRIYNGMLRESDGMWISGYNYWLLNYVPMLVNKVVKGTKKAVRIKNWGSFWEGIWWRHLYLDASREAGEHSAELSKRGSSKSYSLASILSHNLILGETAEANEERVAILTAYQKEYLQDSKDGTLKKFVPILSHVMSNTPFPHLMLTNSSEKMTWQMGYTDANGNKKGSLNMVMGVSSKDDSDKLRGKRGYILFEEFGNFPNLLELYDVTRRSVEEGDYAFSQMILVGTANNKEANFQSAKTLLYSPKGYRIHELNNVYDKKGQGRDKFTYFFPAYINRLGLYNDDGISDVTASLLEILMNRYRSKYGADPTSVLRVIAEDPITPAEAIIKVKDAFFPVQALTERAQQLDQNPHFYDDVYIGELIINSSGEVVFKPNGDIPIRTYPVDNTTKGALEIYRMPEKDRTGKIFTERYILSCLKEGEFINTMEGLKKVEDITLNDKLIDINGNPVNIQTIQKHHNEDPVYTLKLGNILDTTTFSKDHPIYCATPKYKYHNAKYIKGTELHEKYRVLNFEFKTADKVQVGDIVKAPNIYRKVYPIEEYWRDFGRVDRKIENPLNKEDFWWLIGLILGDGWAAKNGYNIHICFNKKETQYIEKAGKIVKTLFYRSWYLVKNQENYVEYCFGYQYLNFFIKYYIGCGAENKHLSEWMKYMPHNLKKSLILGYIASDGYVSNKGVEIVSVSHKLINDIQDILFSLGVISNVHILRSASRRMFSEERLCNTKVTYTLRCGNNGAWKIKSWTDQDLKFNKLTVKKLNSHIRLEVEFTEDYEYLYIRIKDIKKENYIGSIYNFSCDTHTFMCNYIPTHNCDPYDNDQAESSSLYSIFVFDLFTDTIVAEYTGRTEYANDAHEMVRKLCLFYNGKALYEANKKGLFAYMEAKHCTHLLADTPEYLRDKQLIKYTGFGSSKKGVTATAPINNYANRLIKDWLNKIVPMTKRDENGHEVQVEAPILYSLKNRALIEELIQFNPEMNFDRVRALGMAMLYREAYIIMYGNNLNAESRDKVQSTYLGNDKFLKDNYLAHKNRMANRQ